MGRNSKKLFELAFWIVIALLGMYMTFFHPKEDKDVIETIVEQETVQNVTEEIVYSDAQDLESLPMNDNVSEGEMYLEGIETYIYFSNTSVIDKGNLPLEVHAELVNATQKYLHRIGYEDVSELYIDEESYIEDNNKIAFNCNMDGYSEQLRIIYEIAESKLKFSIVD